MSEKKSKAIRRQATLMLNGKPRTPVEYEIITHAIKYRGDMQINPETKILEAVQVPYNPRQLVVKSRFDIIVRALKRRFKIEMRTGNVNNVLHTA